MFTANVIILYLLLLIVTHSIPNVASKSFFTLPNEEYEALVMFYKSAGGAFWRWAPGDLLNGYPWNITNENIQNNPCSASHRWQGVYCTTDCSTSPCHVNELQLSGLNISGTILKSFAIDLTLSYFCFRSDFTFSRKFNLPSCL